MFAILAYSAAVSIATLGILLLRRSLPTRMALWTHRYGTEDASTAKRLKISSPPLFLWLLVLLITVSFAAAYYRDQSESLSHDAQIRTTVWIDHSLSSQIALRDTPELKSKIIDRILRVAREPLVIRASTSWGSSDSWENRVEIIPATSRDLLED